MDQIEFKKFPVINATKTVIINKRDKPSKVQKNNELFKKEQMIHIN